MKVKTQVMKAERIDEWWVSTKKEKDVM